MGKRRGDPLHQDMDLNNKHDGADAGDSSFANRAAASVLAQRQKAVVKRRNTGGAKKKKKKKASAPSIKLDVFAADDSNKDEADPFAAFAAVAPGDGGSASDAAAGSSSGGDDDSSVFPSGHDASLFQASSSSSSSNNNSSSSSSSSSNNSGMTKLQTKNMRRLNKTFKNTIVSNFQQFPTGDWSIQMMEYISFAKQVMQSTESAKGSSGSAATTKKKKKVKMDVPSNDDSFVMQPRITRRVTPHPNKLKKQADDEENDDGNNNNDDDDGSSNNSNIFGTTGGSSDDIFGTGSSGDAASSSDIFGTGSTGGDDGNIFGNASSAATDLFGGASTDFNIPMPAPLPAPEEDAPKKTSNVKALKEGGVDEKDVVHKLRSALYKFKDQVDEDGAKTGKKGWTKYGVGDVMIKSTTDEDSGEKKSQLLMYNDTTGKLFINTAINSKTTTSVAGKGLILQVYYPEECDGNGAWFNTMLKCKTPEIAKALAEAIEKFK